MLVAGLDIGSRNTKAVVLDDSRRVLGRARLRTHPDFDRLVDQALRAALSEAEATREDLDYLATTGFGRHNVPARDLQVTEITAAARGAAYLFPGTRSVLDIGHQNTRAIRIEAGGRVKEFRSNDKCAAGAGGFLERGARYLEVGLDQLGPLSLMADQPLTISSVCAVLAESEIINHISEGHSVENIVHGMHDSLAGRALALLKRAGVEPEVTLVGGTSHQAGMVVALNRAVGVLLNVGEDSDLAGAIGAALLGLMRLVILRRSGEGSASHDTLSESRICAQDDKRLVGVD
jgi:(R)-2-hydroxyacyl-CoA dehydratese activating ATPase